MLLLRLASAQKIPAPLDRSGSWLRDELTKLSADTDHILWIPSQQAARPYGVRLSSIVSFLDSEEQTTFDKHLAYTGRVGSEVRMCNGDIIRLFTPIDDLDEQLQQAEQASTWDEVFIYGQTENKSGALKFNARCVELVWQWGTAV